MRRRDRPKSPALITEPGPHRIAFDMCVFVPELVPWVRVTANEETGDVKLAAGYRIMNKRGEVDDDGA